VRRVPLLLLLLFVGRLLISCTADDMSSPEAPTDDSAPAVEDGATCDEPEPAVDERDVAYAEVPGVDANLLSLDVSVPATCEPVPVVVWVHGGGWEVGDKRNPGTEEKRRLFTEAGYAFVAVNYRLSPAVTYPTHEEDVADALAYVDEHAEELRVDANRIALLGHSAGAGIVSLLGTDQSFLEDAGLEPDQLACTVSLDTEAYDVAGPASSTGRQGAIYENAFTDDPATWAEASPVNHVDGDEAPFLIVTRGNPARVEIARAFAEQLTAAGGDATLLDASPYTHEDVNRRIGTGEDDVVTPAVTDLFSSCLA
jgi:arylformamidase